MEQEKIPTREGALIKAGPCGKISRKTKACDLFEAGILGSFVRGSGQYVILPKGTRIMNAALALIAEYVKEPLQFEEVVLPKIAPVDSFRKAGVLGKWDSYLLSVKPFSSTKGVKEECILDPLQCIVFYQALEKTKVDVRKGPVKWFDHSGPTFRNEDKDKISPGVKQREFHRAEFIYLGKKRQVIETRENCLGQIEKLCNDLGLRYRIVVGAGCYQLKEGEIEKPSSVEEIPVKDLEIYCPGYKNAGGKQWLEVAGCSVLADTMTSRFNIRNKESCALWSGCVGIGLNRLMYAIISSHGTVFEKFPEKLRGLVS